MEDVKKILDVCDWFKISFEDAVYLFNFYRFNWLETHKDGDYKLILTCAKNGLDYDLEKAFLSGLTHAETCIYIWLGRDKITLETLRPLIPRIFSRIQGGEIWTLKKVLNREKLHAPFENFKL